MKKEVTLHEACVNPDGKTYNGYKLVQWLYEATTGKKLSDEEAAKIVGEAQEKAAKNRGNS